MSQTVLRFLIQAQTHLIKWSELLRISRILYWMMTSDSFGSVLFLLRDYSWIIWDLADSFTSLCVTPFLHPSETLLWCIKHTLNGHRSHARGTLGLHEWCLWNSRSIQLNRFDLQIICVRLSDPETRVRRGKCHTHTFTNTHPNTQQTCIHIYIIYIFLQCCFD